MKKFLSLVAAVAFASTAFFAQAATPRAAEDLSAEVASTTAPMPKVKKAHHAKAKHGHHHAKARKVAHKKHGKAVKGKKKKAHAHHH